MSLTRIFLGLGIGIMFYVFLRYIFWLITKEAKEGGFGQDPHKRLTQKEKEEYAIQQGM